ncbi:hypothetical protein BGZ59_007167 [Podila verticillata]|nr:hypothetical protein BGZ59_007167 [Podila verticillata]
MAPARSSGIDTNLALLNSPILDLKFNLTSCHRPDSPTSLEDSQSESGDSLDNIDSSATSESETTDTKTKDSRTGDPSLSSLPLSQVATPPLSPAQPLFDQETQEPSSNLDIQDLHLNELSCNMDVSGPPLVSGTISSQPSSCTIPKVLEATAQGASSAWKSLLPGVASTPPPMAPMAKSSRPRSTNNNYKSHDLRLNEILPIVLPPEREAKLSMEMIDLFESLLPTEESHKRRTRLIKKIEDILHIEWPGQDIKAEPFGSTVNGLGTSTSDVDLCITTTWPGLKNVQMLATAFRKHGMQKVFCVAGAKVPIVKLWDPELHLSCDMNINTPLGLMNTRLIKTYVAIDPRVRPFAMIIKHWARKRVLNDAGMEDFFVIMRSPPILPALHDMPHTLSPDNQVINGNNTSFCDDLSKLEGFGYANKETLGGLLYAFFRRFAIEYDYDHHVISVRHGRYLTKESKDWHIPGKHYKLFCVEEPLDTSRNLGNSSDMASSKGLKQEFGRALDILIHRGSLNECCEQWVFPPIFYNNNFRNGENSGYHHTHHAAGRRYTFGYRQNNNHNNHTHNYYQYKDQPDIDDDDDEESEHYTNDRSYANFRSMVTTTSTGNNGGYRTNRSNSAPKLDVSAFSARSKQSSASFGINSGSVSNNNKSLRLPPVKNGMASSFSGSSFLDQDPFGAPPTATPSRNRSKSVGAVESNIVAIRPPTKQEKSHGANATNVSGSATGTPRQRRSKSSNRGDGSKQVGNNNNNNNNNNGASYQSHNQHHQQSQNQYHNHSNNSTSGANGNNSGINGGNNGNRQGRSNGHNNHNSNAPTNGSGRSPRSTVEFSLADIAPKAIMSSTHASNPESRSGNDGKKGGNKRNVVWSTNSNRGESRGNTGGNNNISNNNHKGPQETETKTKSTKALAEHQAGPREASA